MRTFIVHALLTAIVLPQTLISIGQGDAWWAVCDELPAVSPAFPPGGPNPPSAAFDLSPHMAMQSEPFGGVAMDNLTGQLYWSEGSNICRVSYPYAPDYATGTPSVVTWNAPATMTSEICALAFSNGPGVLWVTDGTRIVGVLPTAACDLVVHGPFTPSNHGITYPIRGLDHERGSANLWFVDSVGTLFCCDDTGSPQASPIMAPFALEPTGLAVEPVPGNAAPQRFYVSYGWSVVEYTSGAIWLWGTTTSTQGLTFHGTAAPMGPEVGCFPLSTTPFRLRGTSGTWPGNFDFSLVVTGATPGNPLTLGFDVAPASSLPTGVPMCGETLFLDITSPTFTTVDLGPAPNAAAPIFIPAAIDPTVPPGSGPYYAQVLQNCITGSAVCALTNAVQILPILP